MIRDDDGTRSSSLHYFYVVELLRTFCPRAGPAASEPGAIVSTGAAMMIT